MFLGNEDSFKEEQLYLDILNYYKDLLSVKKYDISELNRENTELKNQIANLTNQLVFYTAPVDSKFTRILCKLKLLFNKLFPLNTIRRIFLSYIKRLVKCIFKIAKKITRKVFSFFVPKKLKRKIKNNICNSKIKSRLFHLPYYRTLPTAVVVKNKEEKPLVNLINTNKKIAVHLHLFYEDLKNEFRNYLSNIPYQFDLYISVQESSNTNKIKSFFNKIINANKVVVKTAKNCGRDFGPMFIKFSEELKEYDYLLHIHTKKSLRSGSEQSAWRKQLLDGTIGSVPMIMQQFELLINYNVGYIFPVICAYYVPPWSHVFLGAHAKAVDFYNRIGLKCENTYKPFSAGSMFWCNNKILSKIYDLKLKEEDFDEECGQDDGKLEYVFERIWIDLLKEHNLDYASYNPNTNKFYINHYDYNMKPYKERTAEGITQTLLGFQIVTFDIFDTLVTRKVYDPDDIFKIIDDKIKNKYNVEENYYYSNRKKAENNVRKQRNYIGDCTIDEIYSEFEKITQFDKKDINEIKNIEIETDLKFIIPREDMLQVYNKLLANNKQIIIISDMFYTEDIITKILNKCGYYNWYKLYVSSETGLRKDNGSMWDFIFSKYKSSVHVGDNEQSDIHLPICRSKPVLDVMSGKRMYQISNYYCESDNKLENSIMKGLVVNKILFNSPFAYSFKNGGEINSLFKYGYAIIGPIMLHYMIWLMKNVNDEKILFVSGEGYYLRKIYNHIMNLSGKKANKNIYLYASRAGIDLCSINNVDDIRHILSTKYTGNIKELLYYRLGIILDENYENCEVTMPNDIDTVLKIIEPQIDELIKQSILDRENYFKYLDKNIEDNENLLIVDLGYSGSFQTQLSKLMNKKVSGAYFVVSENLKPLSIGAKVMSCFNSVDYDNSLEKISVGKYHLWLEAFLTSPDGQFVRFDNNIQPCFRKEYNKRDLMNKLDKVYQGAMEFIDDMNELLDRDILDYELDKQWILDNFDNYVKNSNFNLDILKSLKVENLYATNSILDIGKHFGISGNAIYE